jgi:hypothetical protein
MAHQTQLATISAPWHAGGCEAVWREGDAGGGRKDLPAEYHLPPRAELHAARQAVQPLRGYVPHPPVGHQDGRARVPRRGVRRADDVHPHGQLHRALAPWMERRVGYRQVVPHVQARRRRARRAVLFPNDARGHVQGGPRGARGVLRTVVPHSGEEGHDEGATPDADAEAIAWVGVARGPDDAAGHYIEEDRGTAGVERTVYSGYEGAYAGDTRALAHNPFHFFPIVGPCILRRIVSPLIYYAT